MQSAERLWSRSRSAEHLDRGTSRADQRIIEDGQPLPEEERAQQCPQRLAPPFAGVSNLKRERSGRVMQGELACPESVESYAHAQHVHVHLPGERERGIIHVCDPCRGQEGARLQGGTVVLPVDQLSSHDPEPAPGSRPFASECTLVS